MSTPAFTTYRGGPIQTVVPTPTGPVSAPMNSNLEAIGDHLLDTTTAHGGKRSIRDVNFVLLGVIATGLDVTNHITLTHSGEYLPSFANLKNPPTGCALVFGLNNNGVQVATIIVSNESPIGNTSTFNPTIFGVGDILTLDILQVGATYPGANATLTFSLNYYV